MSIELVWMWMCLSQSVIVDLNIFINVVHAEQRVVDRELESATIQ
jgi:hypothetical protein